MSSIPCDIDPMGVPPGDKLPPGYTGVEWLESTGTAYINSGWPSTQYGGYSAKLEFMFTADSVESGQIIGSGDHGIDFRRGYGGRTDVTRYGDGANIYSYRIKTGVWTVADFIGTTETGFLSLNGVTVYESSTQQTAPPVGSNLRLFTVNGRSIGSSRLKYADIWDASGQLKFKFRPALDPDARPCLYDFVSQKPFYASGTGEFLYA